MYCVIHRCDRGSAKLNEREGKNLSSYIEILIFDF